MMSMNAASVKAICACPSLREQLLERHQQILLPALRAVDKVGIRRNRRTVKVSRVRRRLDVRPWHRIVNLMKIAKAASR